MTRSHARCAAAAENLASRAYVGPPYTVGQKFTRPACCAAASATDRYLLLTSAATGQTDGPTDGHWIVLWRFYSANYAACVEKLSFRRRLNSFEVISTVRFIITQWCMDRPSAKAKMRILSCGAACQLRVNHCQAQCRTDIKLRAAVRPSVRLSVPCPLLKKMRFTATPMTTIEHK